MVTFVAVLGSPALNRIEVTSKKGWNWENHRKSGTYLGVSENSVPLHPMVNDHYPMLSLLNGYNWEYTLFSDKPICRLIPLLSGKKPVISDALAVLWLTSGSSAYQLRVFAATVCQTGGQRRRLERPEKYKEEFSHKQGRRTLGHHVKPGDKSVLTYSKEAYTSLYGKVFASEISSWARSIQSQGLDEMLTHAAYPLATTPLVNLVRV